MRIAAAQAPGALLTDWANTRVVAEQLVADAADAGAEVVVLPECVWPAYCLGSVAAYQTARAAGLPAPSVFVEQMQSAAARHRVLLCVGYVDEVADGLANAAALISADGELLGVQHKCFLWDFDRDTFVAGKQLRPIDTPIGPVGVLICADARLPEIPATLAARGARLMLQPTAWVNVRSPDDPWNPQHDFLIPSRAAEHRVPFASASKWGREDATTFVGRSLVCDADGAVRAQCATAGTTLAVADVELGPGRQEAPDASTRATVLSAASPTPPATDVPTIAIHPRRRGSHAWTEVDLRPAQGAAPIVLRSPDDDDLTLAHIRIVTVADRGVHSFAPLRQAALEGTHLAVIFGDEVHEFHVRARACENRMFVIWCRTDELWVIDVGGNVVARGTPAEADASTPLTTIDPRDACDKQVASRTDVIHGRCTHLFEF